MKESLEPVLERIGQDFDASTQRLLELLAIPSVGTDPAHHADTRRAASWLKDYLGTLGFEAGLRETPGHPIVVAHAGSKRADVPHLLYYGHYDVQPADPLELWQTPPFEPTLVEGTHGPRVVARGAVDDKGQVMTFIQAMAAWRAVHGDYPARITILLEGEEESGSSNLSAFLAEHADELRADVCVISDTGMLAVDKPAITYMLRGLAYFEVTIWGPRQDLHSGIYGGAVPNPINVLARLLAGLHDANGRVAIPGFYDDVVEPSAEELAGWAGIAVDEQGFLAEAGLTESSGEAGRTLLERVWSRPTCDVNGIWGGYTAEGAKTVIPSHASAKMSFRLVPGQEPEKIVSAVRAYFTEKLPSGCRLDLKEMGASPAIRVATESAFLQLARQALSRVFDQKPVLIGCGGSIPVVGAMKSLLGLESLLLGFGLDDDKVHGPNEKFELVCYRRGIEAHAAFLAALAATSVDAIKR
ncbi:Acetylornithine deacetylase/Succinyl-diaminopimelate desuccinylase [Arboricoccus pini]|uniref:Acetylornithine deacetylase/Succinyl-diaminopimelate desuccinylase n=1 Tax=Arboricoccus pini TaxID=1963835 RepID=A0A212QT61_9PROT|nr:dipeptidase [Arboricoccus pini]SNB62820.1 Acetylornithine deacetylase/Succinyl-diaminopimelate desuccinylase [Arboricoccus pini]